MKIKIEVEVNETDLAVMHETLVECESHCIKPFFKNSTLEIGLTNVQSIIGTIKNKFDYETNRLNKIS
jgi:hypothetical protein